MRKLEFSTEEVDTLVLAWLNRLSAVDMDRFFWDYPGPFDYSQTGYGLGRDTARRIVEARSDSIDGLRNITDVMNVKGVGSDKMNDMRIQAREALALARYHTTPHEPVTLWKMLLREGSGMPLSGVIAQLKKALKISTNHLNKTVGAETTQVLLKIPFVALAWVQNEENEIQVSIDQFIRVRIKPWAFAVHDSNYLWSLNMKYIPDNNCDISLEKGELKWLNFIKLSAQS
ncbi:MAG: hypothetical protein KAV87_04770 [Desulfobacteraceae bacterium]|nr:hypothetical protein [Desulfobacteraceae bacterium]